MKRPKTPTALEAHEASVIANAVRWSAFQRRDVRDRQKHEAATRAAAEEAGRAMLADSPRHAVLIYAIDAAGRQVLAGTLRA